MGNVKKSIDVLQDGIGTTNGYLLLPHNSGLDIRGDLMLFFNYYCYIWLG